MGNPQPREQNRCAHARDLADDFPVVAPAQTGHQHQPVNVGMPARDALRQNMCPFEMHKAFVEVSTLQSQSRQ